MYLEIRKCKRRNILPVKLTKEEEDKGYRLCSVCGEKRYIENTNLWSYKRVVKGKTMYMCGYNCMIKGDKERGYKIDGRRGNTRTNKSK